MPLVASVLLEDIKTAMDLLDSFTLERELVLKTSKDADANLISMQISGSGYVDGDNDVSIVMDIDTAGFAGKVTNNTRTVGGVAYIQDSLTGDWSTNDAEDDGGDQSFVPKGMVATDVVRDVLNGLPVYRVTGTVPDETENELVIIWAGTEDLLVRQIRQEGKVPSSDYANFQVDESGDLFQSFVSRLSGLNQAVQIEAPPVDAPPVISEEPSKQYAEAPPLTIDTTATYLATMRTSMGEILIELFASAAPETVNSFIFLATEGFYDDVIFHRVIPNFMIQGGDPTGIGSGGAGYYYNDEFDSPLVFDRTGVLAMANSGPNTNSSQFFITTVPTPHLNGAHTIFGQVVEGQEIVDAISTVSTDASNRPAQAVVILGIEIMKTSSAQ